jgi:hypothetical protein
MRLRHGVHAQLEEAATELIRKSLEGVTARSEKADILTAWKEKDRLSREVYTSSGLADGSLRRGMYHRAWNSESQHLNSRDGMMPPTRIPSSLMEHIEADESVGTSLRRLVVNRNPLRDDEAIEMTSAERAVVAGRTTLRVAPISRWGSQTRYKCRNCTCYMAKPSDSGTMTCRRCLTVYQPYEDETYAMVVPNDVTP